MKEKLETYSLEELTDTYIGDKGTPEREQFEFELRLDVMGDMIKHARIRRKLTQEQLGQIIGVQKAQISKIETNAKDVRLSTIVKVLDALKAKVKMSINFDADSFYELA